MSRPRYGWWGYVRWVIRKYPERENQTLEGVEKKEQEAVEAAVKEFLNNENGQEKLKVVQLVMFNKTHTLEGAAMVVPCSYETAKRWVQQFIRLVAKNYGLLENINHKSQNK